jgi:hypothetical protein
MRRPFITALCLAAACAPAVSVTNLSPTPRGAQPDDHPVAFFEAQLPRCAYEELALLRVRPKTFWTKPDDLANAMRARAQQLGGDAVIRVSSDRPVTGASPGFGGSIELEHGLLLSGTVVRFRDPSCKEY